LKKRGNPVLKSGQKKAGSVKRSLTQLFVLFSVLLFNTGLAANELKHQVLEATDQRQPDAAVFSRALTSNDVSLQKAAILGLGRIGAEQSINRIATFLYAPQPDVRLTAAYALSISGQPAAYERLLKRLPLEDNAQVLAELLPGIGLLPKNPEHKDRISVLLPFLNHDKAQVVAAACDGLNNAWTRHRSTISVPNSTQVYKLLSLAQTTEEIANHCLYALTRLRTEAALFDVEHLENTTRKLTTDYHHKLMLLILSEQSDTRFIPYIVSHLQQNSAPGVQAEAAKTLARYAHQSGLHNHIKYLLASPYTQVKIGLLDGLGANKPDATVIDWLTQLKTDDSDWVKFRALSMLYAVSPAAHARELKTIFESRADELVSITWQLMLLQVVQSVPGEQQQSLLQSAGRSGHQVIQQMAQQIISGNAAEQEQVPDSDTPPMATIEDKTNQRLTMVTNRGEIVIQLWPSTPYTSYRFYNLASNGFYDGTLFHRVIPNFVAQGGDPEGTGSGGPGYQIREELFPASHLEGTIGMASLGKDTAGGQFFFNLKDNYHLDRAYTVFGRVVSGMDVVATLERGDYIISIKTR
jgi:cyclophilin family peptidyl-prolyl cis-trans isomerase/HEAT repeat protein